MVMNSEQMEEACYYHWLYRIPGVGKVSLKKILAVASPRQLYEKGSENLHNILDEKKCSSIEQHRRPEYLIKEWKRIQEEKINVLYYGGKGYPSKLLPIPDPPLILYQKGKMDLWDLPTVAVVGARNCSLYGKMMAKELGKKLALNGIVTVSGMARGIDGICQWHSLEGGGNSIGVLGSGVQVCYPQENYPLYERLHTEGCLLSESPPYTKPSHGLFPPRNRIISGLADLLVVVEAREKSGTLITVDMALEQGKEVYCVPGRLTDDLSKGCNYLIKMGAGIILSVDEFVEEICRQLITTYKKEEKTILEDGEEKEDSLENKILSVLDVTPLFLEEIWQRLSEISVISLSELMDSLLCLQIQQKIGQDGQYYYRLS